MPPNEYSSVVPAHLSFLTIYNPTLGTTDETLHNQIVYYYSKSSRSRASRRERSSSHGGSENKREDENEKLRQVGLAQGMVSFAKTFSGGEPADTVETEKSRLILRELEPNWWILAVSRILYSRTSLPNPTCQCIDLTRLIPAVGKNTESTSNASVEYSSREVAPPYLLLQQLHRAHAIFLLHHASSFDSLSNAVSRDKFCRILSRFWTRFAINWDVLLHGNPAVDVFNGMKLSGSGELGIGVGEEEWGSGEREVLEGFISRTDGLVDMMLSRFADPAPTSETNSPAKKGLNKSDETSNQHFWLGCGSSASSSDGVVFSGIGRVAAPSMATISHWMQWIYQDGEEAYGVREDPGSTKRRKKRRNLSSISNTHDTSSQFHLRTVSQPISRGLSSNRNLSPGIPPPLVIRPKLAAQKDTTPPLAAKDNTSSAVTTDYPVFGGDTFMKMITLGYGSAWGRSSKSPVHPRINTLRRGEGGVSDRDFSPSDTSSTERGVLLSQADETPGMFIIGLRNGLESEDSDEFEMDSPSGTQQENTKMEEPEARISSRTVNVSVVDGSSTVLRKLRVVVYLYRPFIFTFLFDLNTPSLSLPSFYRSIHHQLGPLQKSLLSSTCPSKASQRLANCSLYHGVQESDVLQQQLYDVVSDPLNRTIRASLPNIPEPGISIRSSSSWTRLDALNVHTQILNTLIETRFRPTEIERTCKTSRGWWVLWMRLGDPSSRPSSRDDRDTGRGEPKVAFLVRKASDYIAPGQSASKGLFRNISSGSGGGPPGGWMAPGKMAEGFGFDAKKYIESLLNLR
ncbi:hypothetical protein LOZ53_004324 [Ophidiomyces ophidiicola]|nr:hypothetical protein LOZ53_004324 [Ophidiomyces ophidiicola]KAI1988339.1 hypothetical protein LOZ54_003234 [Ophidiomyces ophidiicola]